MAKKTKKINGVTVAVHKTVAIVNGVHHIPLVQPQTDERDQKVLATLAEAIETAYQAGRTDKQREITEALNSG